MKFVLFSFIRRMKKDSQETNVDTNKVERKENNEKDLTLNTVNGLLLEPMSPSLIINNDHYNVDHNTKIMLLGNF